MKNKSGARRLRWRRPKSKPMASIIQVNYKVSPPKRFQPSPPPSLFPQEVRRELGISTFDEGVVELPKIKKKCEKCNLEAECEYYSRQMRSADEGQTSFYKCTSCLGQFTEN